MKKNKMFLLFISLLIFIPYMNTEMHIPVLSEYEVLLLSDKADVIVIALDENDDSDLNYERYETIKNAAIYFANVEFALFDHYSSEYIAKEQEVSIPSIFYISKGEILASYSYPESGTLFLYLCGLISTLKTQTTPISSLSDLYCSLTANPFTILTSPSNYNHSIRLQMELGRDLGFIDVKKVTPDLLSLLDLNNRTIALFRKEDQTVVSTQLDADGIRESSLPIYRYLMATDILSCPSGKFIFALFCDFLRDEEDNFLYEIGEKYAESVIVGYGINIEEYAVKFIDGIGGNEEDQILVFNYDRGFYFNASKYFDIFIGQAFSASDWINSASKMIDDILNNVIQPIYLSEKSDVESEVEVNKCIQKVVGQNYEEFVMDENHDVIMLYMRDGCPHCHDFLPVFIQFAEECIIKENLSFLKFGIIDIEKNSSPKKFPIMAGVPHCHFFPAKNKSRSRPISGGRDRNSLIRLIKENSENHIPFEAPPADKAQLAMEMMQMLMLMDQIPDDEKENLIDDMNKLADFIKDSNETNTTNEVDKKNENDRKEIRNDML